MRGYGEETIMPPLGLPGLARALLVLALVAAGCTSSPSDEPAPGYSPFLAAADFTPGANRFPFALVAVSGESLDGAAVEVAFHRLEDDSSEPRAEAAASFRTLHGVTPHLHEDGTLHPHDETAGFYVVERVLFDAPGVWEARFVVEAEGDRISVSPLAFSVASESSAPNVGDPVPASRNPTSDDVDDLREITTHDPPVADFYRLTVADALELEAPALVVFSTPMFCISRICGPVTDVVASLHESYRERLTFVHIEPFDLDVARSEGRLRPTDTLREWGLRTEPWVFLLGEDGRVATRFRGASDGGGAGARRSGAAERRMMQRHPSPPPIWRKPGLGGPTGGCVPPGAAARRGGKTPVFPEVARSDGNLRDVALVSEAGQEGRRKLHAAVHGDDGGQTRIVAVDQKLVELLLGPGSGALRTQVVQHQKRRRPEVLEALVVGDGALRCEGGPQVVQKVGHRGVEDGLRLLPSMVHNRHGKVGLAHAGGGPESTSQWSWGSWAKLWAARRAAVNVSC